MPQQQRAHETRLRLMDAAQACFAQQGYDATGVAEICQRAGVSKGAFYHHFSSKQALFLDLLNRWLDRLDIQFAAIRAASPRVSEGLQHMAEMMQTVLQDASGQLALFLEFMDQARRDSAIWEATVAPYRRYRAMFAEMIAEGVAQHSLRQIDPDLASGVLVSLAVGVLVQSLFDPDGPDWSQVVRTGVQMLIEDV
jgi:AcrR family transcriptional regulator